MNETTYQIRLYVDGEIIETIPTDLADGEKARAEGHRLLRERGVEVTLETVQSERKTGAVFLRNGAPYSNLVGGFEDALIEAQVQAIKGDLTREPQSTWGFVRAGRTRGRALGLLSILETRGEVIRTQERPGGNYSWALPVGEPMTEANAAARDAEEPNPLVEMTLDARERSAERLLRVVETMRGELDRIEATAKLARDGEAIRRDDLIVNHQYASELLRYGTETLAAWEAAGLVERFSA